MDDVAHNELMLDLQRTFRKFAGHLSDCNKFKRHANRCPCGFIDKLIPCAFAIPTELHTKYVVDRKKNVMLDISAVIADSVRRAAEPKPHDYYDWCTKDEKDSV
jgi:hypothetical protein